MCSKAIPGIKGIPRKFQFHQITKEGFDWDLYGTMTADGDGKIFKFGVIVEFYDQTKSFWTEVERNGDWPDNLFLYSTTLNSMNPHQIFLFGGYDKKKCQESNDLWLFHTQTLLFKNMEVNSEKMKGRTQHQAVMMGQMIVILGDGMKRPIVMTCGCFTWKKKDLIGNRFNAVETGHTSVTNCRVMPLMIKRFGHWMTKVHFGSLNLSTAPGPMLDGTFAIPRLLRSLELATCCC